MSTQNVKGHAELHRSHKQWYGDPWRVVVSVNKGFPVLVGHPRFVQRSWA